MSEPSDPPSLCLLPWLNLSLDVDGTSRPCCKYEHQHEASTYRFANLADTGLAEVWNSAGMQQLRRDFAAGARPSGCSACWDEEAAGVTSFRQSFLQDRLIHARPDTSDVTPAAPVALDLKLSNACNLKCRICGPVASSLWLNEELKTLPADAPERRNLEENKAYYRSNKITEDPVNLEELRRWVGGIESLEMTGGEPMLSKENRDVLELVATEGSPEQVALTLTTNATVMDDRILELLPRFGQVVVALSIDDIGERLEYQRGPLDWSQVDRNLDVWASLASDRLRLFTNTTVSTLNVWYLGEYLTWIHDRFPGGQIEPSLNLVHGPRHFCIQVLPPELKSRVAPRLEAAAAGPWPDHIRDKVDGVREFLLAADEPNNDQWRAGLRALRDRDAIRDESFADTHPQWHAEIAAGGWWDLPTSPRRRRVLQWLHR